MADRTPDPHLGNLGAAHGTKAKRPGPKTEPFVVSTGAGEAIRTPDPHLGKVMLYP